MNKSRGILFTSNVLILFLLIFNGCGAPAAEQTVPENLCNYCRLDIQNPPADDAYKNVKAKYVNQIDGYIYMGFSSSLQTIYIESGA